MQIKNSILGFAGILLASCSQFKTQTTEDGLKYTIHTKNEGKKAKEGDILTFHMVIKTPIDSVLQDTYKNGGPYKMPFQPKGGFKGSFEPGLGLLSAGDSATFYVSADSIFKQAQQPLPVGTKPGSDLKFIVKMISIQSKEEFEMGIRDREKNEGKTMEAFVKKNFPTASTTASGISFLITKPGVGAAAATGDTVSVDYTGKFLDGKTFDSSIGRAPIELVAGTGMVIPGWDEMLINMKAGEKRTVVIPSKLAYGAQGSPGAIDPFSTLVFDMEMKAIKKK